MFTLLILATGLLIVVGGILAFRLDAFVALILAGITVAVLTPSSLITRSMQLESAVIKVTIDSGSQLILAAKPIKKWQSYIVAIDRKDGNVLTAIGRLTEIRPVSDWPQELPSAQTSPAELKQENSTDKAHLACYRYEIDAPNVESDKPSSNPASDVARIVVLSKTAFDSAKSDGAKTFMSRFTTALGLYCGSLAILIVCASIIGRCLLDSGAADRIVRSALAAVGEKNAPVAFVISGFTLSIPVFFDTVFLLMVPLAKALRLRTGHRYLLYVLAIVAGGTMAHSLVPPTPGPLFIVEAFGVSMSSMIVGGTIVGLISASVGMLFAFWANRRYELALPDDSQPTSADSTSASIAAFAENNTSSPSLWVSLIPVLLPVLLITLGGLTKEAVPEDPAGKSDWSVAGISVSESVGSFLTVVSEKNMALLLSAIFAVGMYVHCRRPSKDALASTMQKSVASAGPIILVTAAGGAFGRMMRQTSVAELLQDLPGTSPVAIVVAAFLVTVAVRTAQGSATVAMMTAAGIFGGLVSSGAAGVDPLYVALAVGCGSKPIAWMNDSGFLTITRMSGMTEREGLRFVTTMMALEGVAGLLAVVAGVVLFP